MNNLEKILSGGDLRSIGQSNRVVSLVNGQSSFDELFQLLFHSDRKIVMRAADAIEKITISYPDYLIPHKKAIVELCRSDLNIELKWHVALLAARVILTEKEYGEVWQTLKKWAEDKEESKLVRVNSIQGLYCLLAQKKELKQDFLLTLLHIEKENIPSLNARIKNLKNSFHKVQKNEK